MDPYSPTLAGSFQARNDTLGRASSEFLPLCTYLLFSSCLELPYATNSPLLSFPKKGKKTEKINEEEEAVRGTEGRGRITSVAMYLGRLKFIG